MRRRLRYQARMSFASKNDVCEPHSSQLFLQCFIDLFARVTKIRETVQKRNTPSNHALCEGQHTFFTRRRVRGPCSRTPATPSDQRTTPRALRTQALQTDTPFFNKGNTNLTRDLPTRILATPPFKSPHLTLRRGSRPCHPSRRRPDLGQLVPFVLCPVLPSRLGRPALSRAHNKPSCRMGNSNISGFLRKSTSACRSFMVSSCGTV